MGAAKPADLEKQLAKAKKRASNATALLVEEPSDAEARQLRDEARAEVKRVEAQLAATAAPVTLPSSDAIASGLRRLLDLLADKPEVGHAALVRCGLRLRVVAASGRPTLLARREHRPRRHRRKWFDGRRFRLWPERLLVPTTS